ncbi:MAG: hydroxyisourate hydrolase [Actinomycetales bacterium]|nr:hydroxyisourate hydrolase [Actinomycetales bacterium]
MTSLITTHVLDTARGRPAAGIPVQLQDADGVTLAAGVTDADGRVGDLGPEVLEPGVYRLVFATDGYLDDVDGGGFYPSVTIDFRVAAGERHYHVPVLLSPWGYSTYRGS